MTTDLLPDLGERLDRLAAAYAPDLSGLQPADDERGGRRGLVLLAAAAAAVLLFVIARPGPDVATESPAEAPEPEVETDPAPAVVGELPPPTFTSADLPAVFARPIDDEPRPLIDFGTARTIELPDGLVSVGTQGDHLICVAIDVTEHAGQAGGSGCVVPAAYLSTRVGTAGPAARVSPDGDTVAWYGGLAPLDTTAVLVDGIEAPFVDGVYLLQTDTTDAVLEFVLDDGTVFRPELGGPAVPRDPASAAGSTLSVDGENPVELTSAGCVRHEHGWDAAGSRGQSWFSVRQDAGVAVSVDGGDIHRTTNWETTASEYDGGVALTITWDDTTTSGEAFLVCRDHDADLSIFTGERNEVARESTLPDWAALPPWTELPIVDPASLSAEVLQLLDEQYDLTTLRRIPTDPEFYVGLNDDHTGVNTSLISEATGAMSTGGSASITLLGSNHLGAVTLTSLDESFIFGVTPAGIVQVETDEGDQIDVVDGVFAQRDTDGPPVLIDASGERYETWRYPLNAPADAGLTVSGSVDGDAIGTRRVEDVLCLRTDAIPWVWASSVSSGGEVLMVRILADGIGVERLGDGLTVGRGDYEDVEIVPAGDPNRWAFSVSSDTLEVTIDVACPADTPHLDDLVAAMRGQG